MRGKSFTMSADRMKPAYKFNEAFNAAATAPLVTPPPPPSARTARSGCHVRFSARFNT
jgi:hypothetical protein